MLPGLRALTRRMRRRNRVAAIISCVRLRDFSYCVTLRAQTPPDAEFCSLDGLMTPPDSPDKIARGQPDFHPMLDAAGRPYAFDVRTGPVLPPQFMNAPAINHAVNRMVIHVGGLYTVEVVGRNIPTIYELSGQLASASARKSSLLGNRGGFAGLTLRSIDRGVAVCDLHLRNL